MTSSIKTRTYRYGTTACRVKEMPFAATKESWEDVRGPAMKWGCGVLFPRSAETEVLWEQGWTLVRATDVDEEIPPGIFCKVFLDAEGQYKIAGGLAFEIDPSMSDKDQKRLFEKAGVTVTGRMSFHPGLVTAVPKHYGVTDVLTTVAKLARHPKVKWAEPVWVEHLSPRGG